MCDAFSVGVDHRERNATGFGGAHEVENLRMDRGLAARKLNHLRGAFGADEVVEHRFHFFDGQAEAGTGYAKQSGQFILQLLLTSMMPRQVCCWWSGHSPQSRGQPSLIPVPKASGIVPGLLNLLKLMYISASP